MKPDEAAAAAGMTVKYSVRDERLVQTICTQAGEHDSAAVGWEEVAGGLRASWLKHHMVGGLVESAREQQLLSVGTAELFCASGGLAVGFGAACRDLGLEFLSEAALDQDEPALSVYSANHSTRIRSVKSATDIVDFRIRGQGSSAKFAYAPEILDADWAKLSDLGALLAGPPCQGHSNLNNRTRRHDLRNQLYLTVPAVAVALEADIVVIENVPAVVHDSTQVVQTAIHLLREEGYVVEPGVLAAHKMGWPQTRQRYFVVARRSGSPVPLADVQAALALEGDAMTSVMWALADLEEREFDERLHFQNEYNEENLRRIKYLHDSKSYDLPPEYRPDCHKDGTTYNAVYGRMHEEKPAPTLTTGFMTPGRGRFIHPTQPRTLTPLEAARLQGFPADYDFFPDPSDPPTKAKLAKWIGDAVPYPLGYAAGLSALGGAPWPAR